MPSKNARLQQWVNYRVRVCLQDSRMLVGSFLAFDRHMNVVLADTEEFRKLKVRRKLPDGKNLTEEKEIKRSVGLVMIRGENVLTLTAEAPPPAKPKPVAGPVAPGATGAAAAGRGIPAGRGMPLTAAPPPLGLVGPVRGVGGPAPQEMVMMPHQMHAPMPMMMMVPPAAAAAGGAAAAAARSAVSALGAPPGAGVMAHVAAAGMPHPGAAGISNSCVPPQQQPQAGMMPGSIMGAHSMGLPRPQ